MYHSSGQCAEHDAHSSCHTEDKNRSWRILAVPGAPKSIRPLVGGLAVLLAPIMTLTHMQHTRRSCSVPASPIEAHYDYWPQTACLRSAEDLRDGAGDQRSVNMDQMAVSGPPSPELLSATALAVPYHRPLLRDFVLDMVVELANVWPFLFALLLVQIDGAHRAELEQE